MSERVRFSLVKGVSPGCLTELVELAKARFPGVRPEGSKWSDWQSTVQTATYLSCIQGDVLVLWDDAWRLADEIARLVSGPELEIRVQEGNHWDFTLHSKQEVIADFSTRVGYFDDNPAAPRPWKSGDAKVFSQIWGVSTELISPYLVDWDASNEGERIDVNDQFAIGDWRQVIDFMSRIGVEKWPLEHAHFPITVPMWRSAYVRQPRWRRVIREVSVWWKGTYPDLPRSQAQAVPKVTFTRI